MSYKKPLESKKFYKNVWRQIIRLAWRQLWYPEWIFNVNTVWLKGFDVVHPFVLFFVDVDWIYYFQNTKFYMLVKRLRFSETMFKNAGAIPGCHNLWEHGSIAPGRGKFSQEVFLDKKKNWTRIMNSQKLGHHQ